MQVDATVEQRDSRGMSVGEAAEVLGLTEAMVRILCRNGKLEHWRDEQRLRCPIVISEASVQVLRVRRGAIVDDGTVSPGQAAKMLALASRQCDTSA
jgi:DNA-binding Xre family transcriptional regulator